MLCQKCGHLEATVHKEEMVYRQKIEQHLCAPCAGAGSWSPPETVGEVEMISYTSKLRRVKRRTLPRPVEDPRGLKAIPHYMQRLYAGEDILRILQVYAGTKPLVTIINQLGAATLMPCWDENSAAATVRIVGDFFTRHGVASEQYPPPPPELGGSATMPPCYLYRLPAEADAAASLVIGLLATCYGVNERDGLGFRLNQYDGLTWDEA